MTDIRVVPDDSGPNWAPPALFKYRPVSDYTRKIIADAALYFASPATFNDPFDFLPQVSVAGTEKQRREFYKRTIAANMPDDDRAERRRVLRTFSNMTTEELRKLMEEALVDNVKRVGVCSFVRRRGKRTPYRGDRRRKGTPHSDGLGQAAWVQPSGQDRDVGGGDCGADSP